jgi:Flp pilus assembly pilin Flp
MEYGLIAALISVSILAGYKAVGGGLNSHWNDTADTISGAGSGFLDK